MNKTMFEITADYRPNNPNKPKYYVLADSRREAKEKFEQIISWLKVYTVKTVDEDLAEKILRHPGRNIIIGDNANNDSKTTD